MSEDTQAALESLRTELFCVVSDAGPMKDYGSSLFDRIVAASRLTSASPSDAADLASARAQIAALTSALEQIQELATDTPDSEAAEEALDDIADLCESTLAQFDSDGDPK